MSTNSRIAMLQSDGSIKSIYCHWDGYYGHNGKILLEHYTTDEKVSELIALGSISSLGEHVNPLPSAPEAMPFYKDKPRILSENEHCYETPQKGVVVAYHRDRDENFEQNICNIYESLDKFTTAGEFISYCYLWKDGKWFTSDSDAKDWKELTPEMVK